MIGCVARPASLPNDKKRAGLHREGRASDEAAAGVPANLYEAQKSLSASNGGNR